MKFTKEQQKIAYKKLPENVRDFIFSNEVNDLIDEIKKELGLTEEESAVADAEILYSLIGLQKLNESIEAIAKISNKKNQDFINVSQKLQIGIFDKIKTMGINLEEFVLSNKSKQTDLNLQNKSVPENISKTTTVEIPPANLPMVEPGEVVHDTTPKVPEARIMNQESGERDTEVRIKNQEASKAKTNTKSAYEGIDPYREPLD